MNDIHKNLVKLMLELDAICREHDIDYFLSGGTALGVVRNQCFLPWDDDIDLFITRDNWKKLYKLVSEHPEVLPENRDLVCIENTKYYRNPVIRYVNTSTTRIYPTQAVAGKSCGDQIEFFILDPIPNIEDGQEEHQDIINVFFDILSPYFIVPKYQNLEEFEKHKNLVFSYYDRIDKEGYPKIIKELYDEAFNYPLEKADTFRLRWGVRNGLYKTRWFKEKRYEILEGIEVPIAGEIEHALRNDYGDTWMYIPESLEQISHNNLIQDTNKGFKEFTDIYLKFIDQDEVVDGYLTNKKKNMEMWIPRRKITIEKERLMGLLAKKEIDKIIEYQNYDMEELFEKRQYDKLNQVFDKYYSLQLDPYHKRFKLLIKLDESLQKIAILNKLWQGYYYDADKILSIIEHHEGLDEDYKEMKEICEYCRSLSFAIYDDRDIEAVEDLLSNIPQGYEDLIDVSRARLHFKLKTAKGNDDYESIIKEGNAMLEHYPDDGELLSHIAEGHFNLGNIEKAKELYGIAVNKTRNGFVWRKAKENVGIDRMADEEIIIEED